MKIRKHFSKKLRRYSDPRVAQNMAYKYLGKTAKLYPARNSVKKYSILNPENKKWINFGQLGYEDYSKHKSKKRRRNYLARTKSIRGDWKKNKYSPNNLSREILW